MSKLPSKPLLGAKVAILVANGFNQQELTLAQRALLDAGANARIVSPESGLVHSWAGDSWGHHYAIDANLGEALGADYAMLVVLGGTRSADKLKLTAHTRRFIGSFMAADKPVAMCGDAVALLAWTDNVRGRTMTAPEALRHVVEQAGGILADGPVAREGNLLTCTECDAAFVAKMIESFATPVTADAEAA